MTTSLLKEFKDLRYQEYHDEEDIPFVPEVHSIAQPQNSNIMRVRPRNGENMLIVKKVQKINKQDMDDNEKRGILKEARCLQYADHPHVVKFIEAFYFQPNKNDIHKDPFMGIVMHRANSDIVPYLEGKADRMAIRGWLRCLVNVVGYIHGLGITHRDIKPPNILIKDTKVLLADFGISKMGLIDTVPTTVPNEPRGRTRKYAAPEVEAGSTRGRSADIFSLGAVFLEMLVAYYWPGVGRIKLSKVVGASSYAEHLGEIYKFMKELDGKIKLKDEWGCKILSLCRAMMSEDRDERPSIKKIHNKMSSLSPENGAANICCESLKDRKNLPDRVKLLDKCKAGDESEVRKLLLHVKPTTIGAIQQASAGGFGSVVQAFLDHNPKEVVNLRDFSQKTALHCAAGNGHEDVVRILLKSKASINLGDDENRTPLHLASIHGHSKVVEVLIENQADVSIKDIKEQTPLHFAAKGRRKTDSSYKEIIRILLRNGADVNAKDNNGKTPREYAKEKGHRDREMLLSNDAPGAILRRESMSTNKMIQDLNQKIRPLRDFYDEADIQQVSGLLETCHKGWGQMAKLYVILSIVRPTGNVLELIDKLISRNVTDYKLPINNDDLSDFFENPGDLVRFGQEQRRVLSETLYFKNPDEHHNLRSNDPWGNLKKIEELGSGGSGVVYKVQNGYNGQIYALKQIDRSKRKAAEELNMLKRVRHQNIVSFVGSFTSPNYLGLLMEPAADYNLSKYLSEAESDDSKRLLLLGYFGCLLDALHYLHNEAYVRHNDIKPHNILVHGGRVFLTDFGISLDWSETFQTTTMEPVVSHTPLYCAPEVTRAGKSRNSKADIWSLGCVFLEMMTILKGRQVNEIRKFFGEYLPQSTSYNNGLHIVYRWIEILKRTENGIGNEPLGWIEDMLQQDPNARPSAAHLRQRLLDSKYDVSSKVPYFGDCCRINVPPSKEDNGPRLSEETAEDFRIEEKSHIAAIGWPGEQRLYFQGVDGDIRQATQKQHESFWQGGRPQDKVGIAKHRSPIAATAWRQTSGHKQPMVRVYSLNEDNYIQELAWNPESAWCEGALNSYRIKAASFSELAVTSWGDGNIVLFYQAADSTIRILHGWARRSQWRHGQILKDVAIGSPLAATNFEHLGNRGLRLYCKLANLGFREFCWDTVDDNNRVDSADYFGGYMIPASPGASICAIASKQVDLEMYVWCTEAECILERKYTDGWVDWSSTLPTNTQAGSISALRLGPGSVRIYFVREGEIGEFAREGGNPTLTVIISRPPSTNTADLYQNGSQNRHDSVSSTSSIPTSERQLLEPSGQLPESSDLEPRHLSIVRRVLAFLNCCS